MDVLNQMNGMGDDTDEYDDAEKALDKSSGMWSYAAMAAVPALIAGLAYSYNKWLIWIVD